MNSSISLGKLTLALALIVGMTSAVYLSSTPAFSQQGVRIQQRNATAYAQLTIQGDAVTWDPGGSDIPRVETLAVTYRRLGGSQRPTMVNLLNAIGSDGWELVLTDGNVWTFTK